MITISLFVAILITLAVLVYLYLDDRSYHKNITEQEEAHAALYALLIGHDKKK